MLAYFYLYGSYVSYIDIDLIIVCVFLLARKVLTKLWIQANQFTRALTTKIDEFEKNDTLKMQSE